MIVRHECNARLLDSKYAVLQTSGPRADFAIKCWRCGGIAKYVFRLPRWRNSGNPKPVRCLCFKRLLDTGIPFRIVDSNADIRVVCHSCKRNIGIRFLGIGR